MGPGLEGLSMVQTVDEEGGAADVQGARLWPEGWSLQTLTL